MQLSNSFDVLFPELDGEQAFHLYEEIKDRLPRASYPAQSVRAQSLQDVTSEVDVFVFDAFGVLNVGTDPIPGAVERIAELRAARKKFFVLTNAASFNKDEAYLKFKNLGFDFDPAEIITSRKAAELDLGSFGPEHCWGVAATDSFTETDLTADCRQLTDSQNVYDEVSAFLFLSVQNWSEKRQKMLEQSLLENPRPVVIANPDIVAPRGVNFSTEPGYFGHRLARKLGTDVHFHGKPFPSVYELVEQHIFKDGISADKVCMVGDTLHTDVLGGAARGWQTMLVTDHGLFKGLDPEQYIRKSGIRPNWMVGSI